jgi:hypothetical protein
LVEMSGVEPAKVACVSHCRAASCLFEKQQSPEVGSNHSRRT